MSNRLENTEIIEQNRRYMKIRTCFKLSILFLLFSATSLHAQSTKSVITGIKAEATSSNTITVTWNSPENAKAVSNLLVYRGTKPFTSFVQTEKLEPIAVLMATELSYTDTLRTSQDYYYAVITALSSKDSAENKLYYDEELDSKSKESYSAETPLLKSVIPGVNSTVRGVHIQSGKKAAKTAIQANDTKMKVYENGALREKPLPRMDVLDEKSGTTPTISKENKKRAESLIRSVPTNRPDPLPVYIFEEDLVSPTGGDEYLLFEILKNYFVKKKYSESITQLRKFLAQNRSKAVADRAAFYLGESYYYTGNFSAALTRFLSLEETYPELSRLWIDSTLDQFSW